MTFRKSILLLIGLGMVAALVACSNNNSTPPTLINVSVSSVATPLTVNSSNPVTATTNDPQGVTWSVTCTTAPCGTFSATQTAGGTATNYIAPPAPTTGVVITATSVTNTSITASTSPAITIGGATLADGTYVFSLAGEDVVSGYGNYYVAGTIVIAGGLITGGEQNFSDILVDKFDAINSTTAPGTGLSTITYSADGNLILTLVTCDGTVCTATDTSVGDQGTETITGTILPLSATGRSLISEFDAGASGSGVFAPQDPTAFTAGTPPGPASYAFVLSGYDPVQAPEAIGGIINVDGAAGTGTISGTGSIFDVNDGAVLSPGLSFTANVSSVSGPDAFGQVIFSLKAPFFTSTINLAGYIVDANTIQLVETHDAYGGSLGGIAYTQASTGTFTAATAAGTYVVGMNGFDGNGVFQAANQLTLTAAGVAGFLDYNDIVNSSGANGTSPDPVTATAYTVDAAGAGDVTIQNITDGTLSYNVQVYLDGNGHALSISMDASTPTYAGDVLSGAGWAQGSGVSSSSFNNASYGLDVTGNDGTNEFQLDGVGPVAVDSSGNIAGTVDLNWITGPPGSLTYPAMAVSGTVVTTGTGASSGVFTGTITGVDAVTCITNASCSTDNFSYYLFDAAGENVAIETDLNQLTLGYFLQQ
jgi:hypothetical protein